jgi:hypothetical protein
MPDIAVAFRMCMQTRLISTALVKLIGLWLFGFLISSYGFAQPVSWQYTNLLDDKQESGQYPDLKVATDGSLHFVYWDSFTDKLWYGKRTLGAANWSFELVAPTLNAGYRSTITLDDTNGVHIGFFENYFGNMRIRYARRVANAWQIESPEQKDRGSYGPAYLVGAGVVQATVKLALQDGKVLLAFFDGLYNPGTFTYGMEMIRAIRSVNGSWLVESFGNIPSYNPTNPQVIFDEGSAGGRYGEYTSIVKRPNGKLSLFTCVKINGNLLRIDQADGDTTLRNYNAFQVVDSNDRKTSQYPPIFNYDVVRTVLTYEGLDAIITPDSIVHLTYGLTSEYNKSFGFPIFWGLFYTRILNNGTRQYKQLLPPPPTFALDSITRTYTKLLNIGLDTLVFTYAEYERSRFRFAYSTDKGNSFTYRTLANTPFPRSWAPIVRLGDSLVAVYYSNDCGCLNEARLPLSNLNGTWRIRQLTRTEERGQLFDAAVTGDPNSRVLHLFYNDNYNNELWYTRYQAGQPLTNRLIDMGGDYNSLALVPTKSGRLHFFYSDINNNSIYQKTLETNQSLTSNTVESGIYGDYMHTAASGDSLHIVYFDPVSQFLRYDYLYPPSSLWQNEVVDPQVNTGQFPDVAIGPGGFPAVAYRSGNQSGEVRYAERRSNNSWTFDTVYKVTNRQVGTFNNLVFTPNGIPTLAFRQATGNNLVLARKIGTKWVFDDSLLTANPTSLVGEGINLQYDSSGTHWLAYNVNSSIRGVSLLARNSFNTSFQQVPVQLNQAQISHSWRFLTAGNDYYLVGQKNRNGDAGLGLLYASGLNRIVTAEEPIFAPAAFEVQLYPNPADELVQIRAVLEDAASIQLTLMDIQGRVVYSLTSPILPSGIARLQIPRGDLPAGMYLLRLQSGEKQSSARLLFR